MTTDSVSSELRTSCRAQLSGKNLGASWPLIFQT